MVLNTWLEIYKNIFFSCILYCCKTNTRISLLQEPNCSLLSNFYLIPPFPVSWIIKIYYLESMSKQLLGISSNVILKNKNKPSMQLKSFYIILLRLSGVYYCEFN